MTDQTLVVSHDSPPGRTMCGAHTPGVSLTVECAPDDARWAIRLLDHAAAEVRERLREAVRRAEASQRRQNVARLYVQTSEIVGKPARADIRQIAEGVEVQSCDD